MKRDPLEIASSCEAQSRRAVNRSDLVGDCFREAAACIREMHEQLHKTRLRRSPWNEDEETRRLRGMMQEQYRESIERDGPWVTTNTPEAQR